MRQVTLLLVALLGVAMIGCNSVAEPDEAQLHKNLSKMPEIQAGKHKGANVRAPGGPGSANATAPAAGN